MFKGNFIWLSVYNGNERAKKFYSKFGFIQKEGKELLFSNKLLLDGSRDVDIILYLQQ